MPYEDELTFEQHPNWTKVLSNGKVINDYIYDIGIVILKTAIDWDKYGIDANTNQLLINTICLPKPENIPFDVNFPNLWRNATFFSFGQISDQRVPDVLQRGDVLVQYDGHPAYARYFVNKVDMNETRGCTVIYLCYQSLLVLTMHSI